MLEIKGLKIAFLEQDKSVWVVKNSSFSMAAGEVLGIVGESGSGKSMTALAITGLLPSTALVQGEMIFKEKKMNFAQTAAWQNLRGSEMGIVFQDPAASLNPIFSVGKAVQEVLRLHKNLSQREAKKETERLFTALGILPASSRVNQYPHQLSGGQKQRVMLAAAISCKPALLVADEPTTALDVTVQAQILKLLQAYVETEQAALLLISHDLGVIAQLANRVLVMCEGYIVEEASVYELFKEPHHPYTQLLLASLPRLDRTLTQPIVREELLLQGNGCVFASRCMRCQSKCLQSNPSPRVISPGRSVRCHFAHCKTK
ncbi:MAG: ABC transporter ATP-binding protein [Firmicutes bacterium]|nr:ABC transporter ATP-binding protein [Bacillota bacterium]